MNSIWFSSLVSTIFVSLISITGIIFLTLKGGKLQGIVFILVSLAVGALLGNVFFHLLPESFESIDDKRLIAILVLSGILVFFVMEKFLHWHHGHNVEQIGHHPKSYGYISLLADSLHNFTDGILIAAGWMVGPEIGIATTVSVIIHEIPQEISDFGILIHAGFTSRKALLLNFYAALSAVLGTVVTLFAGENIASFSIYVLPLAAGGFIYLAGTDLMPELNKDNSRKNALIQMVMILAGLALVYFVGREHSHNTPDNREEHHIHSFHEKQLVPPSGWQDDCLMIFQNTDA
jgi:zinc and cadmium transporter